MLVPITTCTRFDGRQRLVTALVSHGRHTTQPSNSPAELLWSHLQARRYQQDVAALEQVFEYIMQSLANYRWNYCND
jgi:hypothetical protein